MMSKNSINRVILVGHVGQDPELKFTTSGHSISTFSLATNEVWIDAEKNKKEHTEWHNIVAWDKLSDFANQYLKKGQLVFIEGKLRTRSWEDKNKNTRFKTEIVCQQITPLEWKKSEENKKT